MKPKSCAICEKPKPITEMFFPYDVEDKLAHVMRCFKCNGKRRPKKSKGVRA